MKKTRAGRRNSHSAPPFRRTGRGPRATRASSSTSSFTIACVIHPIQPIQLCCAPVATRRLSAAAPRRSALFDFGLHGLLHLRHGHLRIGLVALEVTLPDRFADDELLEP